MVALAIAPVIAPKAHRSFLATPTGSYYMVGTPSTELAEELVQLGVLRVVFSADHPRADWKSAERILEAAGIEVVASWN